MGERIRLNIEMEGGNSETQHIKDSMTEMEKGEVCGKVQKQTQVTMKK